MNPPTTQRLAIRVASLAAAIAASFMACKPKSAPDADSTERVTTVGPENIAVVSQGQIETGPHISGALAPGRQATIRAEISGPVIATNVESGQSVAAGMWLAQLDDTQIQVAFLSARSALSAAEVEAASAEREEERAAALAAAGAISDRDLDQAKRMNTVAKAQLADAKSRLALAQKQVDATRILAPFAGVISERTVTAGDLVQPGNALFTVIDPSSMRLEASLPAQELSEVKVGSRVSFSVSGYSGGGFSGRITRISPAADRVTGQIRILASIPNPGRTLVSGLFAEGRVATHSESALLVPVAAVDLTGLVPSVTRMKDGRAQKVDVQTGLRDAATEMIQIVSGVAAGDTLLLGAAQGLPSGAPVRMSPRGDVGAPVSSTPGGYQE